MIDAFRGVAKGAVRDGLPLAVGPDAAMSSGRSRWSSSLSSLAHVRPCSMGGLGRANSGWQCLDPTQFRPFAGFVRSWSDS